MSEAQSTTDVAGIERTATGAIVDKTPLTEKPTTTTETKPDTKAEAPLQATEGDEETSLLNEGAKKDEVKTASTAPEKYEPFKLPEGFQLQEGVGDKINATFREAGLSQEAGQKLVDLYSNASVEAAKAADAATQKLWADTNKEWRDAVKADPKLGPRLAEVRTNISRMYDTLVANQVVTPTQMAEIKEAMDFTGAGNHPAMVRLMDALSVHFNEGTAVKGNNSGPAGQARPGAGPASAAHALYPNLP